MAQPFEISPLALALVSAGAALAGALIGALASVAATYINARHEARRKHAELVVQAAIADFEHAIMMAKGTSTLIPPLGAFFVYYDGMLDLIENRHDITPPALNRINDRVAIVVDLAKQPVEEKPSSQQ